MIDFLLTMLLMLSTVGIGLAVLVIFIELWHDRH